MPPLALIPRERPKAARSEVSAWLSAAGVNAREPALVGVRGYYKNTMGLFAANDTGMYDDAFFLISPSAFAAFNANTDPSREHPHVATLTVGVWWYQMGTHGLSRPVAQQYRALVQAAPVTVSRAPTPPATEHKLDTGLFGINIHRGGLTSTSSEGCQTLHPTQWSEFIRCTEAEMQRYVCKKIPYLLREA